MTEREQLASLFAKFLRRELNTDEDLDSWDALRKSKDPTIINGCQIFTDHFDDVEYDIELLDKTEWDYLERVRLSLVGGATIEKIPRTKYGWRNVLSTVGLIGFLLVVLCFGVGYYLLAVSFLLGMEALAVSNCFPKRPDESPYQKIITPFRSFEDLRSAYDSSHAFRKIKFDRSRKTGNTSSLHELLTGLFVGALAAVFTPVLLIVLSMPDTTPTYQAAVD